MRAPSVIYPLRLLLTCAVLSSSATAQVNAAVTGKKPLVLVERITPNEVSDLISYPARVISKVKGSVYSLADGVVTRIIAPLGTRVKAGASLIEVKNTDPAYDYQPVRMNAAVSGVVSAVEVTEGSSVTKGQNLATVTDPGQMELRIEVPAADLGGFHRGLNGKFKLPLLGENFTPLDVRVQGVSPLVDPLTGTATAEVVFVGRNFKSSLVPLGALGKVAFAINTHMALQVPDQAILYRGKTVLVRTVVAGKVKLVPVSLGSTYRGLTEVKHGLSADTLVIVSASTFLADGQDVTIQNQAAEPPPTP